MSKFYNSNKQIIFMKIALLPTLIITTFLFLFVPAYAQRGQIQYLRPYDFYGINQFETADTTSVQYEGLALRLGANFTQGYQILLHSNSGKTELYSLSPGFPLAQANLNIDVQLLDGIRLNLVSYLSTHHHNETWVKGGYVQIDKVEFLKSDFMNRIWNHLTLKVGHMEINYGDAHFRRSDGGNTFWNPFIENNIMDAFTTEIGGELYWQNKNIVVMGGITNGEIQGSVTRESDRGASVYGKIGYDKQFNNKIRGRITASILDKRSSINGTLYGGDRTGSNYQYVMEPINATLTGNAFSGRVNPNFKDNLTAVMINPFLKIGGFELFGTFEISKGNTAVENGEIQYADSSQSTEVFKKLDDRQFVQSEVDVVYRFCKQEKLYVGAKYNYLTGKQVFGTSTALTPGGISQGSRATISVDRISFAAGWFITNNILIKGEYVIQEYNNFPQNNLLHQGNFNGFVFQGSIAF